MVTGLIIWSYLDECRVLELLRVRDTRWERAQHSITRVAKPTAIRYILVLEKITTTREAESLEGSKYVCMCTYT